jgi:hypothetical protein
MKQKQQQRVDTTIAQGRTNTQIHARHIHRDTVHTQTRRQLETQDTLSDRLTDSTVLHT